MINLPGKFGHSREILKYFYMIGCLHDENNWTKSQTYSQVTSSVIMDKIINSLFLPPILSISQFFILEPRAVLIVMFKVIVTLACLF